MTVNLLGLQNTLAYLRIIYFLKGFSSFGPLVRMIMQIIADVRPVRARTRSNATPLAAPPSQRSLRLLLREIAQATAARASRGASSRFRTRVPATPICAVAAARPGAAAARELSARGCGSAPAAMAT